MIACTSWLNALAALVFSVSAVNAQITVFAAASLSDALTDAATAWEDEGGAPVTLSFAGSSQLARQIEAGAPADIYISANQAWMDALEASEAIVADSRIDLLTNQLVVIAHGDAPALDWSDAPDRLRGDWFAMALVEAVPAGIYGKAALQTLGAWDAIAPKVAQTDNVRAALALVSRGEAPHGLVYKTDAAADDGVTVIAEVPTSAHTPILYPAALTADASPEAALFLDWLAGEGQTRLLSHGFGAP
ncbi:MAG: molybdate ABC transporter substrate-binding protein [Pseudomonadota bacterium]